MTTTESTPTEVASTGEAAELPGSPFCSPRSLVFFRGFLLFMVIILVNAAIQTALVGFFDPTPAVSAVFIITALISFVVLVASFYFLNSRR